MSETLKGRLLVATPNILDPNFYRTVVFMCEHEADRGGLGLVLNRPVEAEVAEFIPQWAPYASPPSVVHLGGPVSRDVALCLAIFDAEVPDDFQPITADIGLFDLGKDPIDVPATRHLRVYSGYAGWSSEQLDSELERGDWFVCEPLLRDVFEADADGLWSAVLRRQPGHIRLFADYPHETSQN